MSVSCPNGGSAHVTGSTAYDANDGLTTAHLRYAMTGCRDVGTNYDLTLDGAVSQDGTFSASSTALGYTGTAVALSGFAGGGAAQLDEHCDLSINRQTSSVSGTVCGRSFSGVNQ